MKKEYDLQNAEQGKFYRPQEELETPVYLDKNVSSFFREVARKKDIDIGTLVNEVLEKEISIQNTMG